jgi:hypothetical protein
LQVGQQLRPLSRTEALAARPRSGASFGHLLPPVA